MNICVDVGNSTIGIGIYKNNALIERMIFNTDIRLTEDEFYHLFKKQFNELNLPNEKVDNIIYSSVVPPINLSIINTLKNIFKINPLLINVNTKTDLGLKVDNPIEEIGNDLIADLVGAKSKYGYPCLIADLGTASKI